MKNEIIEDEVETQTYENLLPGRFETYDAGERQLFKQSMISIVLVKLMYEFDGVSGSEFFGLPLLSDSCEEVVGKWKNEELGSSGVNSLEDDSKREENINAEILVLLSVFFGEIFYLLRANGYTYDYARSAPMDLFFRELLHLDENDEIYWKLIGLSSLIAGNEESAVRQIKRGYFAHAEAFANIMRMPHIAETMGNLMVLFGSGKQLTRAEVLDLCKENVRRMKT